jgi:nucleoside-diphosphate-sugar epimerase
VKAFVTGGAGFIGKPLCAELERRGWEIIVWDHSVSYSNDILHFGRMDEAIDDTKPDVVVHLAAAIYKADCENKPKHTSETNIVGTLNVAKICAAHDIPLVYTSTSEVYGDHGRSVVDEDMPAAGGDLSGMYAITKLAGEMVAFTYAPKFLKIVRPCMPYGPGVPPGRGRRALDNLIWQALTGQPMVVHRGAARSWVWIDDLARGFADVIEKGEAGIYNVGRDDDETQMIDLAGAILDIIEAERAEKGLLALRSKIEVVVPPTLQTPVKRISCARLRALGWEPTVDLDEGLPKMVEYIEGWIENDSR